MNSLLYYLLQVIIASAILYLYYHLALRNKKFHQYNRFYLLGAVVISILVPFLNIPVYFTQEETQSSVVLHTLTVLSLPGYETTEPINDALSTTTPAFNPYDLLYYAYAMLAALILVRIIVSLVKVYRLRKNYPAENIDNIKFIHTNDPSTPFSFFNWLFWNKNVELKSEKGEQIFRHELFHIRQCHSLDVIFMEILTMIFWINPFFYLIKKELRAIHEFLADQFAVHETEKWNYTETLLMHVLQTRQSLVNPFFHNQIKRRIAMITNPQKTSHKYLRKLLVLPVAAIVVSLFAFKYKNRMPVAPALNDETITIVVDAGHGGTDPGAKSPDKKYTESELALSLAKMVQKLSPEYNVNVVMTRENGDYPGGATNKDDGLRKRVEITNGVNPTAFISLHVNSSAGLGYQQRLSGIEAFVTNRRMDDPGKSAASAILQELSQVYKTATDLKFRKDAGIWVLDKNNCPTILLQCGYINNAEDLKFITDQNNQEKIARSILKGIVAYSGKKTIQGTSFIAEIKDSIPNTFKLKNFEVSFPLGIILSGENITVHTMPGNDDGKSKFELIIINNQKYSLKEAEKKLSGMIVKSGDLSFIPSGNEEAIRKYGSNAKNGVVILQNAIIVKKNPEKIITELTKSGFKDALLVIDGNIQDRNDPGSKTIDDLLPNDIKSLTVLKDSASTALYGEQGKNGVIIITTKETKTTLKPETEENYLIVDAIESDPVFTKVEGEPTFPGGEKGWIRYLERNFDFSIPIQNLAPAGNYTVYIQFTVEKNGSLSDVKPLTNHGFGMEEEAMRLIAKGPAWKPAIQNGKEVKAIKKQRIDFSVKKSESMTPRLTKTDLQKITVHKLLQVDESIEIKEYVITIDRQDDIWAVTNHGNQFNEASKKLIAQAQPGRLMTIDKIRIMKDGVETKIPSKIYGITN